MSDVWLLRLAILVAGIVLFGAIIYFGQPRKGGQGRRRAGERLEGRAVLRAGGDHDVEVVEGNLH